MSTNTETTKRTASRYIIVAVLVAGAFFGAYRFAAARGADASAVGAPAGVVSAVGDTGSAAGAACACCGSSAPTENGLTGDEVRGSATLVGDAQTISVDLSNGYYEPNAIVLKAGVPTEITFGQSSGCTAQVMSEELGFFEDLTTGPRTVKLPALDAGEYSLLLRHADGLRQDRGGVGPWQSSAKTSCSAWRSARLPTATVVSWSGFCVGSDEVTAFRFRDDGTLVVSISSADGEVGLVRTLTAAGIYPHSTHELGARDPGGPHAC